MNPDTEELIPADAPRWSVLPVYYPQTRAERVAKTPLVVKRYELLYGAKVQTFRKGEHGQLALLEIARFCNRRKMEPRVEVECAADATNPEKYISSHA